MEIIMETTTPDTDLSSDEWIAAHPEVTAAAPGWADKIEASDDGPNVALSYDRTFGAVEIGTAATWIDGVIQTHDHAPAYVYFAENERGVTSADLRQFAAEFAAAADAMEAAGA